MYFLLITAHL